jgi:hypothetical protein
MRLHGTCNDVTRGIISSSWSPAQPFAVKGSVRSDSKTGEKNFSVVICFKASPSISCVSTILRETQGAIICLAGYGIEIGEK